jgi:glutamate carboxypeptidase
VNAEAVTTWLAAQYPRMLLLLEELVNIDSGSHDKSGVDRLADRLAAFFVEQGLPVQSIEAPSYGRATVVRCGAREPTAHHKGVLLIGHRDTVFPQGEAHRRPFCIRGERAYGPGVCDMKAGLVLQAFVTVAMNRFAALPIPLTLLTTGDEEISSPWSRPHIEAEAKRALAVFNAEPGRPNGGVVIARKGSVFLNLDVQGRAAHAGVNFFDGASAVSALAHKVLELDQISDASRGVTLNVGTVQAGQSVNTVAPQARAQIDLRYVGPEDRTALLARIHAIAQASHLYGTAGKTEIDGEMLPMPERPSTLALFAIYKDAAAQAGFESHGVFTGGCSDSGFTSAVGAPTLCAVGPTGGMAHTRDEFVELASVLPRTLALALSIFEVARRGGVAASSSMHP